VTLKIEVKLDGMADVAINNEASGCVARPVLVGIIDGFEPDEREEDGFRTICWARRVYKMY
jgi:hypothetical protein